jgi:hypothetical protein
VGIGTFKKHVLNHFRFFSVFSASGWPYVFEGNALWGKEESCLNFSRNI